MADIRKGNALSPVFGNEVVAVTGAATAKWGCEHLCTGTSADYTLTLPTAVGHYGEQLFVRMGTASTLTKIVTIDGNSSETVAGATTRKMWSNETAMFKSDGANIIRVGGILIAMYAKLTRVTSQTLTGSTYTAVTFTAQSSGTPQMWDSGNGRISIVRPEEYECVGEGFITGISAAAYFGIMNNSADPGAGDQVAANAGTAQKYFTRDLTCAAGDYVVATIYGDGSPVLAANTLTAKLLVRERLTW